MAECPDDYHIHPSEAGSGLSAAPEGRRLGMAGGVCSWSLSTLQSEEAIEEAGTGPGRVLWAPHWAYCAIRMASTWVCASTSP